MRLPRVRTVTVLGTYLPATILCLIVLTAGATILGELALQAGAPLLHGAALVPGRVLQGELWRLVSWTFVELHPLSLIFVCLTLAWFGRDLSNAWGHWRFVAVYLGFTLAVATATCLIGLVWEGVRETPYLSAWPMGEAILIAWAIEFPHRQMLAYLVLPIGGRNLIYLTVATTALFAIFSGPTAFVPHFLAIGFMLVFARYPAVDLIWMRFKLALLRRSSPRGNASLRVVRKQSDEPPRWLH